MKRKHEKISTNDSKSLSDQEFDQFESLPAPQEFNDFKQESAVSLRNFDFSHIEFAHHLILEYLSYNDILRTIKRINKYWNKRMNDITLRNSIRNLYFHYPINSYLSHTFYSRLITDSESNVISTLNSSPLSIKIKDEIEKYPCLLSINILTVCNINFQDNEDEDEEGPEIPGHRIFYNDLIYLSYIIPALSIFNVVLEFYSYHRITNYEGGFYKGKKNGFGTIRNTIFLDTENTYIYTGTFKDDIEHGLGEYILNDGGIYNGEVDNNLFHGYGELFYDSKTQHFDRIYKGYWNNGERCGKGYSLTESEEVDGEYKNDMCNGYCKIYYHNGIVFEGLYIDDDMVNGIVYEGNLREKFLPKRIYKYNENTRNNLMFINGIRNGITVRKIVNYN